jgi:hypothetical protein
MMSRTRHPIRLLSPLSVSASQSSRWKCMQFAEFEKSRPSEIVPVALELALKFSFSSWGAPLCGSPFSDLYLRMQAHHRFIAIVAFGLLEPVAVVSSQHSPSQQWKLNLVPR